MKSSYLLKPVLFIATTECIVMNGTEYAKHTAFKHKNTLSNRA